MPRETNQTVQDEGGIRVLNLRAVRVHHNHVQAGLKRKKGCEFCREGLAGVAPAFKKPLGADTGVAEGDRTDEEGTTPPASGDGRDEPPGPPEVLREEFRW